MTTLPTPMKHALGAPRRGVAAFFSGLAFPFRGARLVYAERPGLVRYWIVPILVTLAALGGSLAAAFSFHDELTAAVWSAPSGEGWEGDVLRALHSVFDVLVTLALVAVALLLTLVVSGVVAAPFNARLADVVDEVTTGRTPPDFALGRALADVGRALVIESTFFALNVLLFVLSIAVPAAAPVLGVLGLGMGAYYFAIAYVEAPQASRHRTLGDRLRLVARHPMAMLGFGTGVGLLVFVPLVNLFFMPAAVAGGVLFFATLERENAAT